MSPELKDIYYRLAVAFDEGQGIDLTAIDVKALVYSVDPISRTVAEEIASWKLVPNP